MYLLDTNVISEIYQKVPNQSVMKWLEKTIDEDRLVFISVLTLGEMQKGIKKLEKNDPYHAEILAIKLQQIIESYADQTLPISGKVALEWGNLSALDKNVPIDTLFAAQAKVYGLTLVTRNIKHIQAFNISFINPFLF